jgi:hypothetical protein
MYIHISIYVSIGTYIDMWLGSSPREHVFKIKNHTAKKLNV